MPFFSQSFTDTALAPRESSGGYINPSSIEDGGNIRLAILSEAPLEGYEIWFTKHAGGMTKRICADYPDAALLAEYEKEVEGDVTERDGRKAIKACSAFFVWDYEAGAVRVFSANQKSLLGDIQRLTSDEDYSDLNEWDLKITRNGKGTDTRYTAMMVPTKRGNPKIAAQVKAAWAEAKAAGCDLEALYYGGSPFGAPEK